MAITHSTVVVVADDGTSPVGTDEWNAAHTIAGSLSWDGATVTTSTPLINLTQTWNASGVTFTAIKANVTLTAAADGSMFQDFQLGGSSKFSIINKDPSGNPGVTLRAPITNDRIVILAGASANAAWIFDGSNTGR